MRHLAPLVVPWPETQLRAARIAGRLVAQGLLDEDEILPPIVHAACAAAPTLSPWGLHSHLLHALRDSCRATLGARDRAAWRVHDALAPLIVARAARRRLLAAAAEADAGGLLLAHERRAIAEQLVCRALARRPRRRRA
ncbi:MAG: hypothetical protein J0H91_12425 [Rhodospirillales bacterium]|nr:hypothetical protein [Rhodospirillales bacterium]